MSYGRARATYAHRAGVLTALDDFTGTTAGAALNGRVAPIGGTWATSGATTDFVAADAPGAGVETVSRATTSDAFPGRQAIVGTATFSDAEAGVDFYSAPDTGAPRHQVVVRYVDASNFLRAEVSATNQQLLIWQRVAGVETLLAWVGTPNVRLAWHSLRIVAYASGQCRAHLLKGGNVIAEAVGQSATLATGGALASGKAGFGDLNPISAVTRYYDNFYRATPAPEPIVCHSGQSIEFRHDTVLREDATGTYSGPPPEYVGARFYVPNAGGPARKARLAVITRRNDVETSADDELTGNATMDATTVTVWATPRYLAIPR